MPARTVKYDAEIWLHDIHDLLIREGFCGDGTIDDLLAGGDRPVKITVDAFPDDLVEHVAIAVLKSRILEDDELDAPRQGDVEDAIRYTLKGDRQLASAMFARILPPEAAQVAERVLS